MDLMLKYLEMAVRLRRSASVEKDADRRARLESQADVYQALARDRARQLRLPIPDGYGGANPESDTSL